MVPRALMYAKQIQTPFTIQTACIRPPPPPSASFVKMAFIRIRTAIVLNAGFMAVKPVAVLMIAPFAGKVSLPQLIQFLSNQNALIVTTGAILILCLRGPTTIKIAQTA